MMSFLFIVVAVLFVGGMGFLGFICMRKYNGNMGVNIGKHNNAKWGMDEGQEKDWY